MSVLITLNLALPDLQQFIFYVIQDKKLYLSLWITEPVNLSLEFNLFNSQEIYLMFEKHRIIKRKLLLFVLLLLSSVALNAKEPYTRAFIDSDSNGIDDKIERYFNAASSTFSASRAANEFKISRVLEASASAADLARLKQVLNIIDADGDADGDGVRDVLEVYGYYKSKDAELSGLNRRLTGAAWNEFIARGENQAANQYKMLADALRTAGWVSCVNEHNKEVTCIANQTDWRAIEIFDEEIVEVNITHINAYNSIENAFIKTFGEYSAYIENIDVYIEEFLRNPAYDVVPPRNGAETYYTDPTEYSTDFDPFSDYEEALGAFNGLSLTRGSGHPLIAALPEITTSIKSYTITDIVELRDTGGEVITDTEVHRVTQSRSFSQGRVFGGSIEIKPLQLKDSSFTISFSESKTWTMGSAVNEEQRRSFASLNQTTEVTNASCFSKIKIAAEVKNTGNINAFSAQPVWDIYIGDELWNQVSGDTFTLLPKESTNSLILSGVNSDSNATCLTLEQSDYLLQGGQIVLSTSLNTAEVPTLDNGNITSDRSQDWSVYQNILKANNTRVKLDLTTTSGNNIASTLWIRAYNSGTNDWALSIQEALAQAFNPVNCTDISYLTSQDNQDLDNALCFAVNPQSAIEDYLIIDLDTTKLVVDLFDVESGGRLDDIEQLEAIEKMPYRGEAKNGLTVLWPSYAKVTLKNNIKDSPHIPHSEILIKTAPNQPNEKVIDVRTTVTDDYGIPYGNVYFCIPDGKVSNLADDQCFEMDLHTKSSNINPETLNLSGYYSTRINLGNNQLKGDEYIKAISIANDTENNTDIGITQKMIDKYYLGVFDTTKNTIEEQLNRVQQYRKSLTRYSRSEIDQRALFNEIQNHSLMMPVNEISTKLATLENALNTFVTQCSYYSPSEIVNFASVSSDIEACNAAYSEFKRISEENTVAVYSVNKLPFKNKLNMTYSRIGGPTRHLPLPDITCNLNTDEVISELKLDDIGIRSPSAQLGYHSMERTGKVDPMFVWSDIKYKSCGKMSEVDQHWTSSHLSADNTSLQALVDFGWSTQRNATELCTVYRTFDLNYRDEAGKPQIKALTAQNQCSINASWGSLESFSNYDKYKPTGSKGAFMHPMNGFNAASLMLKVQYTQGHHIGWEYTYQDVPNNTLADMSEYRLISDTGYYLTIDDSGKYLSYQEETGEDNQIWVIDKVNDREVRLKAKNLDAYITRNDVKLSDNNEPLFAAPSDDDNTPVNYNQHWRINEMDSAGKYEIQSVVALRPIGSAGGVGTVPEVKTWTKGWKFEKVKSFADLGDEVDVSDHEVEPVYRGPSKLLFDTAKSVNNSFDSVDFGVTLPKKPAVFAHMQTFNNADTATTRVTNVTRTKFDVKIERELPASSDVSYSPENVGYFAVTEGEIANKYGDIIGEVGFADIDQLSENILYSIPLLHNYADPVAVITLNSSNNDQPVHIRIQSVSNNSLTYKIEGWDNILDNRMDLPETVAYMVVERGDHEVKFMNNNVDIHILRARHAEIDHQWQPTDFEVHFSRATVNVEGIMLSQSQTTNASDAIVTRQKVRFRSYDLKLQEGESSDGIHTAETVGIILLGTVYMHELD